VAPGSGFGTCQVLAEKGNQYAIYIFGKGPFNLRLAIPSGEYDVTFLDPLTLASEAPQRHSSDGHLGLTTPAYAEDVAIRIVRAKASDKQ
jgi:hypothetical protein